MAKKIIYNQEARNKLKAGVDALADAVGATLGPLGRNVAIDKGFGAPIVTHDGVTVAKEIDVRDKFENMGVKLVMQAAERTGDSAGDGTTTATVLAQAMVEAGLKSTSTGSNPMLIRRGLEKGVKVVVEAIEKMAKKVETREERERIATNSAQDEKIGKLIADAMEQVGPEGVITIEDGRGMVDELNVKTGMTFDSGYISSAFLTNQEALLAELVEPHILVTDRRLSTASDVVPMFESFLSKEKNSNDSFVVIADTVEDQALGTLIVNKLNGSLKVLCIKAPSYGERRKAILEDIAYITGATFLSEEINKDLRTVTIEDLGRAAKVISSKEDTTVIGGLGNQQKVDERVAAIKAELKKSKSEYETEMLQVRLAKLTGGIAVIDVGAATEAEMRERKARFDDAIHATQAAVQEGIVVGGGVALLKARKSLKTVVLDGDEQLGIKIIYEAMERPFRKILTNAGVEAGMYIGQAEESADQNIGYNVLTRQIENLFENGVIDPAKVTKLAMQNAVSVTISILTTDALVAEDSTEKDHPTDMMGVAQV